MAGNQMPVNCVTAYFLSKFTRKFLFASRLSLNAWFCPLGEESYLVKIWGGSCYQIGED